MSGLQARPLPGPAPQAPLADDELAELAVELEDRTAAEIIGWATERFGTGLCLAASMADTVLIDQAHQVDPDIEVVFLDTGFHFAETLGTLRRAMVRYALRVEVLRPEPVTGDRLPDPWTDGVEACCKARKSIPLDRHLAGRTAWMTGLRRADSPDRADTPIVERDRRGLIKVNPLANWTDDDVDRYLADRDPVVNPLLFAGYPSIGCWPCTEPVGADGGRDGRWVGLDRTECGIHV